jgi:hypothetical protein
MSTQVAAELQVVLEGVPLPADRAMLLEYARGEDERAARLLEALPEREYATIDEVGEELARVQPAAPGRPADLPRPESGKPPGGDDYVRPHPDSGAVRPNAPASNPPSKAIEEQTKTQKKQRERQQQLLG